MGKKTTVRPNQAVQIRISSRTNAVEVEPAPAKTKTATAAARAVESRMTKTRTSERLSIASNKSTEKNRSDELDVLKDKFETFVKQLKPFAVALQNYHVALVILEHNRSEVLQHIEALTTSTPLFDETGKGNRVGVAGPTWAKSYCKKAISYCRMERQLEALNLDYARQIEEYCIEYVNEWEIVVTTRIRSNLKQADDLRKVWQHYDKKVKQLLEVEAKASDKGKDPDRQAKDRLKRNQEKLNSARQEYDKCATSVCHLIDSAMDCAWMDMTPLMIRMANMELERMGGQQSETLTSSISDLIATLKAFARQHKIDLAEPEMMAKPAPPSATKKMDNLARAKSPERTLSPKRLIPIVKL